MADFDWHGPATIWLRFPNAEQGAREHQESTGHSLASAVAAALSTYGEQIETVVIRLDDSGREFVGTEILALARDPARPSVA
jgi:hypothetical protein